MKKNFKRKMDQVLKCVFLGDSSCGKTKLISAFVNDEFEDNYEPTISGIVRWSFISLPSPLDFTAFYHTLTSIKNCLPVTCVELSF